MDVVRTKFCIVGAGAAGITMARSLLALGHEVLLLESGEQDFNSATQDLYAGPNLGAEYYDLDQARLRFFGGTTNIWGGRSVPLTAIDYEQRDWVPFSGWPIGQKDLEPYLQRAHQELELGAYQYARTLWDELSEPDPFANDANIESWFWRFDEVKERFGWQAAKQVREHPKLRLMLGTNALEIEVNEDASQVTGLVIATLSGQRSRVCAQHYVLACGGIENPRLLLASAGVEPSGVGNGSDQVGRYFMEHPHARLGYAETDRAFELWYASRKRQSATTVPVAPAFALSPAQQKSRRSLNNAATFKLQLKQTGQLSLDRRMYHKLKHSLSPAKKQRALWHLYRAGRDLYHASLRPPVERAKAALGRTRLQAILRAEQAPNPNSRVLLTDERDALGMARVGLDWQLTELDKISARALAQALHESFQRAGYGTFVAADWLAEPGSRWPVDPSIGNHPIGGYHHLGTTRMSADPNRGVVDSNCTVHNYANLHIAGSSVFATGGWANPTLTILALSLRLAEHLDLLAKR